MNNAYHIQYLPSRNKQIGTDNIIPRMKVAFHVWYGESYVKINRIYTGVINNILAKIKHKPTIRLNIIKQSII